jgi:hypothetical protein
MMVDPAAALRSIQGREMTPYDDEKLSRLEATITRSLLEAGVALAEIRDLRLYRRAYATFEDYCIERWGFTRSYAYRQIAAADVTAKLSPIGYAPPNEGVAREFARIQHPDLLREVGVEVLERHGSTATAAQVRGIVDETLGVHGRLKPPPAPVDVALGKLKTAIGDARRVLDSDDALQVPLADCLAAIDRHAQSAPN